MTTMSNILQIYYKTIALTCESWRDEDVNLFIPFKTNFYIKFLYDSEIGFEWVDKLILRKQKY